MNPAMFALNALPSIFGSSQVGPAAPAPNLGTTSPFTGMFPEMNASSNAVGDAIAKLPGMGAMVPEGAQQDAFDLPGESPLSGFKGFLGGIDKGLQSPSQLIGLGLLSQLSGGHPAAGIAGLLGMGLLNK